jgi:hypothetical protein
MTSSIRDDDIPIDSFDAFGITPRFSVIARENNIKNMDTVAAQIEGGMKRCICVGYGRGPFLITEPFDSPGLVSFDGSN